VPTRRLSRHRPRSLRAAAVLSLLVAPGLAAQRPFTAGAYAGQSAPLLPLTLVTAEPPLRDGAAWAPYRDRAVALRWADSLVAAVLRERAPEVTWIVPDSLRKVARRNTPMLKPPDEIGHVALRGWKQEVAEPVRAYLRSYTVFLNCRYVMAPVQLVFREVKPEQEAPGDVVEAGLLLAWVDSRSGTIRWRETFSARGASPAAALLAALGAAFPLPG